VISEFLASNGKGLADEDGEFSDWIEVQNVDHAPLSLEGYHLTDSAGEPAKWTFPDVTLGPGEYLVVFASGKDRAVDAGPLHTNFRLSDEGEYLGLVAPDGTTVLQQFSPAFPRQRTGISYGAPQSAQATELVTGASAASILTPGDGQLGATWTQLGFDASAWQPGVAAIGYDQAETYGALIGTDLEGSMLGAQSTAYVRVPFHGDGVDQFDFLNLDMRYDDGFIAYLNGVEVARRNAPAAAAWNSTATADHSGVLDTLAYPDFNGGGLTLLGSSQVANGRLRLTPSTTEQRGTAWTTQPVQFSSSYSFSTEFVFEISAPGGATDGQDGVGGEGLAFTIQSTGPNVLGTSSTSYGLLGGGAAAQKFVSVEFDTRPGGTWDSTRASGSHVAINNHTSTLSVSPIPRVPRFNDGGLYHAWVDYDGLSRTFRVYYSNTDAKPDAPITQAVMDLRSLFSGEQSLYLGFSASTSNGTNVHEIVEWNFASGDSELGLTAETINLTEHLGLLRGGENVLAIHGLNVANDDRDFLVLPRLVATDLNATVNEYRFFDAPTPGRTNGEGLAGLTEEPEFSLAAGVYKTSVSVELSSATPGASIYYTLNNTAPTTASTLYTGPIVTDASTIIRAIALRDDYIPSETVVSRYSVLAPDVQEFSSNLPLVVLDTYTRFPTENTLTEVAASFVDVGADGRATLDGEADYFGRGAFKLRGSSSLGFPKQQYAFEVWDETGADRSVSLLGMPEESDWIIYAPYSEKALMQNALAYDWSRRMGQYAPRVRFIELYMNTSGAVAASDYRGVYILIEKIKRDPARVDIAELNPEDNSEPDVTGGYILKKDRLDPGDTGFATSRGQVLGFVEPKEDDITPSQRSYITAYMNAFEAALYGPNFADPVNGYAKYIDVDSFIDHHIMVEMTKNIDGYRLSTFMYKDRGGKLVMGPIWDYNLSMGNANYLQGELPAGWYYPQLGGSDYPWYARLFQDVEFQQRYIDRWTDLRKDMFSTERLMADVDAYTALLGEAQVRNFQRWPILGVYVWPNPNGYAERNTYQKEVDFLKNFMRNRLSWIDSNWPLVPSFSHEGGQVPEGFRLDLISAGQPIYYTTDGSDPRLPGGAVNPGALRAEPGAGTVLVPVGSPVKYFVPPDNALGQTWKEPAFDDSAWKSGTTGLGFDDDGTLAGHFSTDVKADMFGVNPTVFVRLPFDVQDARSFKLLRLRLKFDDGVIAYLNGTEIFVRNVTSRGRAWNGAASANRTDAEATMFENIDLTPYLDLLKPTGNVLAFQVLNQGSTNPDFLFSAEIADVTGKATTLELTESVNIKARTYLGGVWSGLNEASFVVGDGLPLRVTELMYNPAPGGAFADADYEYIELQNVGATELSLKGARFTTGVEMTLPDVTLTPGERALVVANQAAFESRYGQGLPILGEYTGRLSNAGEQVTLVDSFGGTILSFTYDDGWYPQTDGQGYSLVIRDANGPKDAWSQAAGWRASSQVGGGPGEDDKLAGDANNDGQVDIEDLNLVRGNYGQSGAGDVNGDGVVDINDLNAVRNALSPPPPAPVASAPRRSSIAPRTINAVDALHGISPLKRRVVAARQWDEALLELIESREFV